MSEPIPKFTLFWMEGKSEVLEGSTISEAMNKAGYGAGSVAALDFYAQGNLTREYTWRKDLRRWVKR